MKMLSIKADRFYSNYSTLRKLFAAKFQEDPLWKSETIKTID